MTKTVTRHTCSEGRMLPSETGGWVHWDDHSAEIDRLRAALQGLMPFCAEDFPAHPDDLNLACVAPAYLRAYKAALDVLSGEPPSPSEPTAPIYGSLTARDPEDVTRALWTRTGYWKEWRNPGPKCPHCQQFEGHSPECSAVKSTAQPWKCDWPGCTRKEMHAHAGMPPTTL